MRILRAADHRRMPWKNGGGVTTEIAVHPDGASLETFEWRVSMAEVVVDGPFSRFDGVDRTLAVLEGDGVVLALDSRGERQLGREAEPFAFPADIAVFARLLRGPIVDLNVMTRRGRWYHRVEAVGPDRSFALQPVTIAIAFCAAGDALVRGRAGQERLRTHDAAVGELAEVVTGPGGRVYAIALDAA